MSPVSTMGMGIRPDGTVERYQPPRVVEEGGGGGGITPDIPPGGVGELLIGPAGPISLTADNYMSSLDVALVLPAGTWRVFAFASVQSLAGTITLGFNTGPAEPIGQAVATVTGPTPTGRIVTTPVTVAGVQSLYLGIGIDTNAQARTAIVAERLA